MGTELQEKVREKYGKLYTSLNKDRYDLQKGTHYHLSEARRAIGYAHLNLVLRNKIQYIEWMNNAIDLLLEANSYRTKALSIPWRK